MKTKKPVVYPRTWWLSSNTATCFVKTDEDNMVVDCSPLARRFVGKPVKELVTWMKKKGGFLWGEWYNGKQIWR